MTEHRRPNSGRTSNRNPRAPWAPARWPSENALYVDTADHDVYANVEDARLDCDHAPAPATRVGGYEVFPDTVDLYECSTCFTVYGVLIPDR